MKNLIGRLFAILAIAMFVMACGDDKEKTCADGEVNASVGGVAKCYQTCETTADCATPSTMECRGTPKLCLDKAVVDTDTGGTEGDVGPVGPTEEDLKLCGAYCQLIYGCINSECTGMNTPLVTELAQECIYGDPDDAASTGCVGDLTGPQAAAARADYEGFVYDENGNERTCAFTESIRCGNFDLGANCGCEAPSNLGAACDDADSCELGSLEGGCLKNEGFPDGACVAVPCPASYPVGENMVAGQAGQANIESRACGADAACMFLNSQSGNVTGQCMATCDSIEDCRTGYACRPFGEDGATKAMVKVCVVDSCESNSDCGTGATQGRCGETTKVCEFVCSNAEATALCESGGGECTGEEEGTKYCTLP